MVGLKSLKTYFLFFFSFSTSEMRENGRYSEAGKANEIGEVEDGREVRTKKGGGKPMTVI